MARVCVCVLTILERCGGVVCFRVATVIGLHVYRRLTSTSFRDALIESSVKVQV
jgi:hypothetical protein